MLLALWLIQETPDGGSDSTTTIRIVAGVLALLGLAALNPERLIADRNIDRFQQTGLLDVEYLSTLSADIDPALHRLPDSVRECVTVGPSDRDPWYLFNLSRSRADRAVEDGSCEADVPR